MPTQAEIEAGVMAVTIETFGDDSVDEFFPDCSNDSATFNLGEYDMPVVRLVKLTLEAAERVRKEQTNADAS